MTGLTRNFPVLLNELLLLNPRENIVSNGVLANAASEVIIATPGSANLAVLLTDTGVGSAVLEGSIDGVFWFSLPFRAFSQAAFPPLLNVASSVGNGIVWIAEVAFCRFARIRTTAWTSGSTNVNMIATNAELSRYTAPDLAADRGGTAVGAAGAAVTLTIAAAGAGLRLYLTSLQITRSASTVLTASAAPHTITSTGIANNPAWTMGIAADAIGIDRVIDETYTPAVPGTALNTAMTIVAPLVAGAIIRITAKAYAGI